MLRDCFHHWTLSLALSLALILTLSFTQVCFAYHWSQCLWSVTVSACACSFDGGKTSVYSYRLPKPPGDPPCSTYCAEPIKAQHQPWPRLTMPLTLTQVLCRACRRCTHSRLNPLGVTCSWYGPG